MAHAPSEPSVIVTEELNLSLLSILPPLSWLCSWCQCLPAGFPLLPGVRAPNNTCRFMRRQRRGSACFDGKDLWERLAHMLLVTPSLLLSLSLALFLSISPPSPAPSFLFSNSLTLICMQMCLSSIPLIVWLPAVSVCVCVCVPRRKKNECVCCLYFAVPRFFPLASTSGFGVPTAQLCFDERFQSDPKMTFNDYAPFNEHSRKH